MEDLNILEAVERYISGKMTPDERVYFEQLRKANPEVDQAVVEHTFFLQQMNRFEDIRSFKATLNDTHLHLAEKGQISSPSLKRESQSDVPDRTLQAYCHDRGFYRRHHCADH